MYDSNNNLVGSIKDDVPQEISGNSVVTSFNEDGEKVVYLPIDESYTLKLAATDDGEMNYSVNEYSDSEQDISRALNYLNIKIKNGDKFIVSVPVYKSGELRNSLEYLSTPYSLKTSDGTVLDSGQDIKGEVPNYMVTLDTNSEEYGMVYGQGVHKIGRFVSVKQ